MQGLDPYAPAPTPAPAPHRSCRRCRHPRRRRSRRRCHRRHGGGSGCAAGRQGRAGGGGRDDLCAGDGLPRLYPPIYRVGRGGSGGSGDTRCSSGDDFSGAGGDGIGAHGSRTLRRRAIAHRLRALGGCALRGYALCELRGGGDGGDGGLALAHGGGDGGGSGQLCLALLRGEFGLVLLPPEGGLVVVEDALVEQNGLHDLVLLLRLAHHKADALGPRELILDAILVSHVARHQRGRAHAEDELVGHRRAPDEPALATESTLHLEPFRGRLSHR
mmetsp:Transcript_41831/g.98171  ORF Transcript_41831/g.98171 Transcript_41831/m.98171 type:complete len:274 (+) Transcript_41831:1198-2019(+)